VQPRRDKAAAVKLSRKLLKKQGFAPDDRQTALLQRGKVRDRIVGSQRAALRANNRAGNSHQPTRRRERKIQGFRSLGSARRLLSIHAAVQNTINVQRHLSSRRALRDFREEDFRTWRAAAYMKVPASTLVDLPDELNFETGAAISCGTGTGQGPVGLSATQLAKAMGATVIALDINPARLARSTEFGADHTIDPSKESTVDRIKEITKNLGADISLETSGASSTRADAVRATRTWGTACYVGEDGAMTLNVSPDLLRKQMTILGSWTFSTVGQADCAKFVAERQVPVDRLFTDRWTLSDAEAAYQLFDTQSSGKGVFLA
jgi:Zinc-binding dehydrogenase